MDAASSEVNLSFTGRLRERDEDLSLVIDVTMEVLVIGFLDSFQTDIVHPMWHPTRIFGYYATVAFMIISADMLIQN